MAQGSYAEDQRAIAMVQVLEQQYEQDASRLTGRPHRPIEHLVVASVVAVVAESHDTERRCHGALAESQYRADQQDLGFPPGRAVKQRGEGMEYGYNRVGQGEHRLAFFQEGPASLPCSYNLSSFCAKSSQGFDSTPPFKVPDNPRDRRSRIPSTGFREYWYPALPAKDVKTDRPEVLRMLGTDVVFFNDKHGEVQALLDWCPHRAVYLSMGRCYFEGFLTCPYHGATFDGDGNCVAFLTEGPDSMMVGAEGMKARKFPTVTLKGMVFVWMGEGEPVAPKEDIPPEMFEEHNICRPSFGMFDCNWVLVLENTMDAHNAFMVHRNALRMLGSRVGGRPRTPLGYRVNLVNDKNVHYRPGSGKSSTEKYYYDEDGNIPYQMYYPGVDGVWPLHRWRLLWTWFFDWKAHRRGQDPQYRRATLADTPDVNEWNGTRLPGMSRTGGNNRYFRSTRWPVPVEENLTRMVYLNVERYEQRPRLMRRMVRGATWPYRNWELNFNFRNQDYDAEKYTQYSMPEYLSSTDSVVVAMRRLFVEHNRDVLRRRQGEEELPEVIGESKAEQMVREGDLKVAEVSDTFDAGRLEEELLRRV